MLSAGRVCGTGQRSPKGSPDGGPDGDRGEDDGRPAGCASIDGGSWRRGRCVGLFPVPRRCRSFVPLAPFSPSFSISLHTRLIFMITLPIGTGFEGEEERSGGT